MSRKESRQTLRREESSGQLPQVQSPRQAQTSRKRSHPGAAAYSPHQIERRTDIEVYSDNVSLNNISTQEEPSRD